MRHRGSGRLAQALATFMIGPMTLQYDERLVRSVVLSYWWRLIGPGYVVMLLFLIGIFLALVSQGSRSWPMGLLAGFLIFAIIIPIAGLFSQYRRSVSRLRNMKSPQANLTLSDERFSLESSTSSSSVLWSAITEIQRYPRFWLLFVSKGQFVTIPLACVPEAEQAFLLEHVRAAGGKVG